jgi:hypothetical protein
MKRTISSAARSRRAAGANAARLIRQELVDVKRLSDRVTVAPWR